MKQNLKISTLLLFCFLSKVYAEDIYDYMEPCPPCPKNITCNFVETNDNDFKCKEGYEGENCEKWICDEENKALIYKCNDDKTEQCIRLDRICDGYEDCQYGEDEKTTCQADNSTCIGPVKLCDGVKDCSDNEDENDCCHSWPEDDEISCPEGKVIDTCTLDCVPKCDGKNDTCVAFHGVYALANSEWSYCAKYSDADEQNCQTSCPNEGEIQCFNADNNPLPLKCIPADKRCDGIRDCETFGEDEQNCPLPPGIICLIVICVIIFLCFVGCIAYYVFKRKNGIYILIKKEAKLQTISEHSTPIIKYEPKPKTESDHSSPTPSLRNETTTSTLPPDFKLPPMAYFNPIDINENGDHHPHFSNHIQSTKTTNAGIIEQLFIDKKPSKQ